MKRSVVVSAVLLTVGVFDRVPAGAQRAPAPPPPPPRITRASDVFFTGANDVERGFLNSRNPGFIIARDIDIAGWISVTFHNS